MQLLALTKPGYHGSLWVDPVTGTILRITMDAGTKGSAQFKRTQWLNESLFTSYHRFATTTKIVKGTAAP